MARTYRTRFIVAMRRIVPFDMLRYDSCWPATSEDAGKLEAMVNGDNTIKEVTFLSDSFGAPTEARWKSFGCKIVAQELVG